jgi:hypothetical protein
MENGFNCNYRLKYIYFVIIITKINEHIRKEKDEKIRP